MKIAQYKMQWEIQVLFLKRNVFLAALLTCDMGLRLYKIFLKSWIDELGLYRFDKRNNIQCYNWLFHTRIRIHPKRLDPMQHFWLQHRSIFFSLSIINLYIIIEQQTSCIIPLTSLVINHAQPFCKKRAIINDILKKNVIDEKRITLD